MIEKPPQRARNDEDKLARRKAILAAALALFEETSFAAVKMADVAGRAHLAKGTVFLYFATKEALFLALLEDQLAAWFDALDAQLDDDAGGWSASRVADVIVGTIVARVALTRLLALLGNVLEQNVDLDRTVMFKTALLMRLAHTGGLLEQRLPALHASEGARLLLRVYAVVIGLRQLCDPAPVARAAQARAEMRPLVVDFGEELSAMLPALLAAPAR